MINLIDIQLACEHPLPVNETQLIEWVNCTLINYDKPAELTLRIVSLEEIQDLNNTYRKMNKPTNVLAFPSNIPSHIQLEHTFLGDIIICPEVLLTESVEQNKPLEAHWLYYYSRHFTFTRL